MENTKPNTKSNFIWNAIGSCSNALSTVLLLLVTTRICGAYSGGIFTIGMALAQQMLTVSSFETGTYFVTDGKNRFGADVHFSAKMFLVFVSLATAIAISSFQYGIYKAICVILICVYKIFDGVSALFFAVLQKNDRIDIAGKSITLRTFCVILAAAVSQGICRAISIPGDTAFMISVIIIAVTSITFIFTFELHFVKKYTAISFSKNTKDITVLLLDCLPMFLGSFILTYICNQPKYVIDKLFTEQVQNSFGIIFIPSAVICMLVFFIYKPLLVPMTKAYTDGDYGKFIKTVLWITVTIIALTLLGVFAAYILGIPILSFIYKVDLNEYKDALCIGIAGGGIYAVSVFFYNIISIMRKQRIMLAAYIIAFAASLAVTKPLTVAMGINGAVFSYLLVNLLLGLILMGIIIFNLSKKRKPA